MLNPVNHGSTPEEIERYKDEPYVMCADIYGAPPHTVQRVGEQIRVTVDGVERPDDIIPLIDDRQDHAVEVKIMASPPVNS